VALSLMSLWIVVSREVTSAVRFWAIESFLGS
jgi:hypothetical protein